MNSIKPFWSWNDKLDKDELQKQIVIMKENGVNGFFMHARVGLQTPYMSNEWFEMIETCLDQADRLQMEAWVYDENGWPSGSADGMVPAEGDEFRQKQLKCVLYDGTNMPTKQVLGIYRETEHGFIRIAKPVIGDIILYYRVIADYIDCFNKEAIAVFLKNTHEKYYERFGKRFGKSLKGFFTDEPQFCPSPWSFVFPQAFQEAYGYELLDNLPLLFYEKTGYESVRNDYQKMVARLFRESFMKQMYDWCEEHHCKLTGHMMGENNLMSQMNHTNGVMACYEYFHEPGIDHLGRHVVSSVSPKQLGSAAYQLGKKTLTETFGLCGWNVSLNELKWIAQWQFLNGVTSLCPHLEGYSMRGVRKRDYPASYFTQLPWYTEFHSDFAAYTGTLGELLDSGTDVAPLLVIHPLHSAYVLHNPLNATVLKEYNTKFEGIAEQLMEEHVLFHYGDETIIEHHGFVREQQFLVGRCTYSAVLLPNLINLSKDTTEKLLAFGKNGGKLYAVGNLPQYEDGRKTENMKQLCAYVQLCSSAFELKSLCEQAAPVEIYNNAGNIPDIQLSYKELPGQKKLLYLVNHKKDEQTVRVRITGRYAVYNRDILKACEQQLETRIENGCTELTLPFTEFGSYILILIEDEKEYHPQKQEITYLHLKDVFKLDACDDNAITLDCCRYRIDNGEWQPETAVIKLQNHLLKLQRPCHVTLQFQVDIDEETDWEQIHLCMENPEKFQIKVNDIPYEFRDNGSYIDHAIRKSCVGEYLRIGKNTIQLSCDFKQPPEVYYVLFTQGLHESLRNKLVYDTELESIYLVGRFGVKMAENYTIGSRGCLRGGQTFQLVKPVTKVNISDLTHQGFWFFSGKMLLSQRVNINKTRDRRYFLRFQQLNAPAAKIYVNGHYAGNLMFSPYELDITDWLEQGENEIHIQLFSGNRNLLGPHHRPEGECYFVGPETFTNRHSWTDEFPDMPAWTDGYNFITFGLKEDLP